MFFYGFATFATTSAGFERVLLHRFRVFVQLFWLEKNMSDCLGAFFMRFIVMCRCNILVVGLKMERAGTQKTPEQQTK